MEDGAGCFTFTGFGCLCSVSLPDSAITSKEILSNSLLLVLVIHCLLMIPEKILYMYNATHVLVIHCLLLILRKYCLIH